MVNERVFVWFDRGEIREALLGENDFFVPDNTYRDRHNQLLVMGQLEKWADSNDKRRLVSQEFFSLIDELCR